MSNTVKIVLAVLAGVALSLILLFGGFMIGRSSGMFYPFHMGSNSGRFFMHNSDQCEFSGGFGNESNDGWGMMDGYSQEKTSDVEPLTVDETDQIIHQWLEGLRNDDLVMGEVMIFDNHSYIEIIESSTGIGAMEVLVDPVTRSVYPEQGPNMMWNLKYSPMGSGHGMGWSNSTTLTAEDVKNMPVSPVEAVAAAQIFLDEYHPGLEADQHSDVFYGYYTVHVLEDGQVIGMLSVHGESGQVFYHDWHGTLIEMNEH
jgi:hypothetical protein